MIYGIFGSWRISRVIAASQDIRECLQQVRYSLFYFVGIIGGDAYGRNSD